MSNMKRTLALFIVLGFALSGCSSADTVEHEEAPTAEVAADETIEETARPLLSPDGPTYNTPEELVEVVKGEGYECNDLTGSTVTDDLETYVERALGHNPEMDRSHFEASYEMGTAGIKSRGYCVEPLENGMALSSFQFTVYNSMEERDAWFDKFDSGQVVYGPNWSMSFPIGEMASMDPAAEEYDELLAAQGKEMIAFADAIGANYFEGNFD